MAERRGGLSHGAAPAELLRVVPTWSSRRSMLAVVRALSSSERVAALCRQAQISVDTWYAITVNDVWDADTATGRALRTSQLVAAQRVNRSTRTVRRARHVNVTLGIMVELYRGRELTKEERLALIKDQPGHQQRGLPNEYAITVISPRQRHQISTPKPGAWALVAVDIMTFGHLPLRRRGGRSSHYYWDSILDALRASKAEPAPPAPAKKPKDPDWVRARGLAGELVKALPWLSGEQPGRLAGSVRRMMLIYPQMTAQDVVFAIEELCVRTGRSAPRAEQIRTRPAAVFAAIATQLDPAQFASLQEHNFTDLEVPVACGRPACDGHGWVTLVDQSGHRSVAKCPTCPPAIRSFVPADVDAAAGETEPAF